MKHIALLVENECQDEEVYGPLYVAKAFGWQTTIVGPYVVSGFTAQSHYPEIKLKRGAVIRPTRSTEEAKEKDYDAVIIPGGWGAERLRQNSAVLNFVRAMHAAGKVVAAICHGPWVLCSSGNNPNICKVKEEYDLRIGPCDPGFAWRKRRMTCYPGMRDDLTNAGAEYVEAPVVVDGNVVTSPHYRNVPEFMMAIKELLEK